MTCDATSLMESARCFKCIPRGNLGQVLIHLLCVWAAFDVENPPAPCQEQIVLNFPGPTVTLSWFNPVAYTGIEIIHININTGQTHLETTLPAGSTTFTTPVIVAGDFFVIRGVLGDDRSGFAYPGPCV